MRIVHVSFAKVVPAVHDPLQWLEKVSFLTGVMEAMAVTAHVTAFFHIDYQGTLTRNGVHFHFTGLRANQLRIPIALNAMVADTRPDAVIVHGLVFPIQIMLLRRKLGPAVKLIVQHHAERPYRDFRAIIQKLADRQVHGYLFASRTQGDEWIRKGQIASAHKVFEVMGTSSPFMPVPRNSARQRTRVLGQPVYLWVGALDPNKDPFTLIRAFTKFLANVPAAALYIIYQSGELEAPVRQLVTGTQIHLVGAVAREHIADWFNSADFIISTSHYEGSGISVCEGMSCGCIPILTDIPSFRAMTGNGSVGFLFQAGDADALHEVLLQSATINCAAESNRVGARFRAELSNEANARKIFEVIDASV